MDQSAMGTGPPSERLGAGGRYRVLRELGRGGMGVVLVAQDERLHREVAVKVLRGPSSPLLAARFLREARILARLRHPNLVEVYEVEATPEQSFLVMQLLRGADLERTLQQQGPLSWARVHRLLVEAAGALACLHENHVIHRDLKPANVFLDEGGSVHLLDFGLALPTDVTRLTQDGQYLGTPMYFAPEVLAGAEHTPATDVYQLGLVAAVALLGQHPLEAGALWADAMAHLAAGMARHVVLPDEVPRALREVVFACLSPSPVQRPQDGAALARLLAEVEGDPGLRAARAAPASPPVGLCGEVVEGRWRLLELIGQGGMGEVYRAEDLVSACVVAFKTLRHEAVDQQGYRRFKREFKAGLEVVHTNVIRTFDSGLLPDGRCFYTMEYLPWKSLGAVLQQRGHLEQREVLDIVRQVGSALMALHARGIIHRDLKPSNLLLGPDGRVVLIDFGLARFVQSTQLTRTGSVLGTPSYFAPETLLEGAPADARSDLYAAGVVAYELLTGKTPFEGPDLATLLGRIVHQHPAPVTRLRPDLAPAWDRLLEGCLAKEPARRPQDATAFLRSVDEVAASLVDPAATQAITRPAPAVARLRGPGRVGPAWVALAVASLALGLAGLVRRVPPQPLAAEAQAPTSPPGKPPREPPSLAARAVALAAQLEARDPRAMAKEAHQRIAGRMEAAAAADRSTGEPDLGLKQQGRLRDELQARQLLEELREAGVLEAYLKARDLAPSVFTSPDVPRNLRPRFYAALLRWFGTLLFIEDSHRGLEPDLLRLPHLGDFSLSAAPDPACTTEVAVTVEGGAPVTIGTPTPSFHFRPKHAARLTVELPQGPRPTRAELALEVTEFWSFMLSLTVNGGSPLLVFDAPAVHAIRKWTTVTLYQRIPPDSLQPGVNVIDVTVLRLLDSLAQRNTTLRGARLRLAP